MTAEYKLTDTDEVIRTVDGTAIPNSYTQPRVDYEEWLSNGGIPDPAAPFPPGRGRPHGPGLGAVQAREQAAFHRRRARDRPAESSS